MTVPALAPSRPRRRPAQRGQATGADRATAEPRVAVVLVAAAAELRGEPASAINRALLRGERGLVIAARGTPEELAGLRSVLTDATVVPVPEGRSDAEARQAGAAASDADVVRFAGLRRGMGWRDAVELLAPDATRGPAVSVIVPARGDEPHLEAVLSPLATAARQLEGELLVVIDGSGGSSEATAAAAAVDAVVRLPGRARGPAYARNRGAEIAAAEIAVFVDADVVARPEVVTGLVTTLMSRQDVAAVFGSFDDGPARAGVVSRYRNLLAHELHQCLAGDVDIFWAACGAVRLTAFDAVGGFDEWRFPEAEVESVELGHRLRRAGHRIVLNPGLQVTHLHRYSLGSLVVGDLRRLVVPWYRVAVDGGIPRVDFPVRIERRASLLVLLGLVAGLLGLLGAPLTPIWFGLAIVAPALAIGMRWRLYRFFAARAGWGFAILCIPLHQLHAAALASAALLGRILGSVFGEPRPDALTEAFAEVGVQRWPPLPKRPRPAAPPASTSAT